MVPAYISGGRKSAAITAQNTGTDWVQVGGTPGATCAVPYSLTTSTSVVQLQRRAIGGGAAVSILSATDGGGISAAATLPRADAFIASAGCEYRLWVPTGGYGNAITLEIGA